MADLAIPPASFRGPDLMAIKRPSRELGGEDLRVPVGFAVTTTAYHAFLTANRIELAMRRQIKRFGNGTCSLEQAGKAIRESIPAGATICAQAPAGQALPHRRSA